MVEVQSQAADSPKPPAEPPKSDPRTIVIAVIGVIGVLGTGVFANWDKLFPALKPVAPKETSSNSTASNLATNNNIVTSNPTFNNAPVFNNNPQINVTTPGGAEQTHSSSLLVTCLTHVAQAWSDPQKKAAIVMPDVLTVSLVESAEKGNLACVRALLDAGAGPNGISTSVDEKIDEQTPLVAAIDANKVGAVRLLLDAGADPNLRARAGRTSPGTSPIAAAASSSPEAAMLLLSKNVDVNAPTSMGMSALHYAVDGKNLALVRALMDKGAKTDVRDDNMRKTPIQWADGNPDIVKLLSK